jgi:hypothetical protein
MRTGLCRELDEKGGDKVTPVLFVDVPKVEIEITHQGSAGVVHGFDILDDCGTGMRQATQLSLKKKVKVNDLRTKVRSCRSQLQTRDIIRWREAAEWNRAHVFHESRVATRNLLTSTSSTYFPRKTKSPFPSDGLCMRFRDS